MEQVPPLPSEACAGCALNGCYPWNTNPLFLCMEAARKEGSTGLYPPMWVNDICVSRKEVTEDIWNRFITDQKREADEREGYRIKATQGMEIMSNNP